MDQIKIGRFIAKKRKSLNLTQVQLADQLGVSNKSVSKWERGICLPDVSLYQDICEILGMTLNEFFAGEDIEKEEIEMKAEENILSVAQQSDNRHRKMKRIIIALTVVITLLAGCGLYTFHHLKEEGYFKNNYVRMYDASKSENAVKDIMSFSDQSNTQLIQFKVNHSYKSVKVVLTSYKKNEVVAKEEMMEIPLTEQDENEGIIAITTNTEEGTCRISEAAGGVKRAVDHIELLPKTAIAQHGSFFYSAMNGFAEANKSEDIPVAALFMSGEELEGLSVETITDQYAKTNTKNDYTFLFQLRFE